MPDGDIISNVLSRQYQKPYKIICEGKLNDTECVKAILNPLRKQIQKGGNNIIDLAKDLSLKLYKNADLIPNKSHRLKSILNKSIRESRLSANISGLLNNAINSVIHDLKYRKVSPSSNLSNEVIQRYIMETYKSSFIGKVNTTTKHYLNTPPKKIQKKLNQLEPEIKRTIYSWSSKLDKGGTVRNLRLLHFKKKKINLEENLL